MLNTTADADALTGLRSPTYYGRPNWDNLFEGISHRHPRTDVGTFYCGPRALEKELRRMCSVWSGKNAKEANLANGNASNGGTKFFFNKGESILKTKNTQIQIIHISLVQQKIFKGVAENP